MPFSVGRHEMSLLYDTSIRNSIAAVKRTEIFAFFKDSQDHKKTCLSEGAKMVKG